MPRTTFRDFAAVVLGAAIAVAAPFVFIVLTIVGIRPYGDGDTNTLAWVVVLLVSYLVGMATLLAAGAVTFWLTRKRWLIPAPYAVGSLLFVAGLLLT